MKPFAIDFDNSTLVPQRGVYQGQLPGKSTFVRLDIKLEVLAALFKKRALAVEDLRGLDLCTKNIIRQLLIDSLLVAS